MSGGWWPSTLQPTDCADPKISLMVSESSPIKDRCRISQAMLTISSKVVISTVLSVLVFFCFFLSLSGSLRALMIQAEAEGTTSVWACLLWMVSFTVISDPSSRLLLWQCHCQLIMETDPAGQSWGSGRCDTATPTGAPQVLTLISLGLNFSGMVEVAGVGWTRSGTTKKSYTLASSKPEAKSSSTFI